MSRPAQTHRDPAIVEAYGRGLSLEKVAAAVGCHPSWVARRLQALGIPRRPRTQTGPREMERNARIAEVYQSGLSTVQVGEQFGLSPQRVNEILADLGIPRRLSASARSKAEAGKVKPAQPKREPPKPQGPQITPAGLKPIICPAGKDHRFTATATDGFFVRGGSLPPSPWVQAITGGRP